MPTRDPFLDRKDHDPPGGCMALLFVAGFVAVYVGALIVRGVW